MSKFCTNCGSPLKEGSEFCLNCGKRLMIQSEKNTFNPENNELIPDESSAFDRIGIFALLLIGYLFVPQLVGSLIYNVLGLSEAVSLFIGNISFVIILIGSFYKMFLQKIKDYFNNFSGYFKFTMKWWGIGLLVMYVSNMIINFAIFGGEIAANEEANRLFMSEHPLIGFASVVLLAPFVEEMIFRFGVRKLSGRNKYFPIISALAFGIPHVLTGLDFSNFFTFSNLIQFVYVIPYGGLGYAFGMVYNKTDNIFCSMTAHAIHNFMCFAIILLFA